MSSKPLLSSTHSEGPEAFTPHRDVRAGMDALAPGKILAKGDILFHQGEPPRGVFILHRGRVRLSMACAGGKPIPYRTVGAGYVLGLPATILNIPYLFTAEVLQRSEVAFIPRAEMLDFLRRRADLCFDVVQQLGGELVEMPLGRVPHPRRRSNA